MAVRVEMTDGWEAHLTGDMNDIIKRLCDVIAEDARRLAPVRTGHLRESIHTEPVVDGTGVVRASADYAGYVELGHRNVAWGHDTGGFVAPQPFLRPALYQTRVLS